MLVPRSRRVCIATVTSAGSIRLEVVYQKDVRMSIQSSAYHSRLIAIPRNSRQTVLKIFFDTFEKYTVSIIPVGEQRAKTIYISILFTVMYVPPRKVYSLYTKITT